MGGTAPPLLRLRASKVTIDSRPPQPSLLSYQLKHFRVQAKKPKSILKKSLKGQNTNTREAVWRGVKMRLGKGELLGSSNRLRRAPVTFLGPEVCTQGQSPWLSAEAEVWGHPWCPQEGMDKYLPKYHRPLAGPNPSRAETLHSGNPKEQRSKAGA